MADDVRSLRLIGCIWVMETEADRERAISFFETWYARVSGYLAQEGHGMAFTGDVMDDGTPYIALIWTKGCPRDALVMVKHVLFDFFYAKEFENKEMELKLVSGIIQELRQTLFVEQQAKLN